MANLDTPFGLRPAYHKTGGVIRLARYKIASGTARDIYFGDPVLLTGSGKEITGVNPASANATPLIGVFQGCHYRASNGSVVFSKRWITGTATLGSEAATALVVDDPFVVFEIQADEDVVVGDIGQDADMAYTAGSSTTGLSAVELDSSDIGTGDMFHILDIVPAPDNEAATNWTKVHVLINEHALRNAGVASHLEV